MASSNPDSQIGGNHSMTAKIQMTFTIEPKTKAKIERAAESLAISTASLIRMACSQFADKVLETKTGKE